MELQIVELFNQIWSGWINPLTDFVSNELFLVFLWTAITLFIFISDKRTGKKVLFAVIIALILHFSISEGLIKDFLARFFFRIRPHIVDRNIIPIGKKYTDSSFPSSHMASTLAVLSVYFYYYRRYWTHHALLRLADGLCPIAQRDALSY